MKFEVNQLNKRNFCTGLILFAFFAFFYAYALQLNPDATFWPKVICVTGMVLSAVNTAMAGLKWKKEQDQEAVFPLTMAQLKRAAVLTLILAAWIFILPHLGFLVTATLATGVIVLLFEPQKDKKNIIRDVIVTLVFSIVLYSMFALLGINFPKGILI